MNLFTRLSGSCALAVFCAFAVPALAQTSDGIGERTTDATEGQSAEDTVQDLLQFSEYQPRYYAVGLRTWAIYTPSGLLSAFFSEHTNMWQEGVTNLAYGGEFTTRIPDKFDVVIALDWANLRTADGYWLEDGDPVRDADYTESNLSLMNLDVGVHWFNNLNRRENLQAYYGFGLGLGVVLGEFSKYDINAGACGWTVEERASEDPSLIEACASEFNDPRININRPEDRIPPVLPAISLTTGLRYLITDEISMSAEIGWKSFYMYGGLSLGYYWFSRE
jgi:hypothetical protein